MINDKVEIVRDLFRIESTNEEYKLRGFNYTELEVTDLLDMVAILDSQGVYELYSYCQDMFDEALKDYLEVPHVGKKMALAMFMPLDSLAVMFISETEPRVLDMLDLRSKLEEKGKDLSDYEGNNEI